MVKKAKLQIVFLMVFGLLYTSVCPSVCQAFSLHETPHSCCSEEKAKESKQNQKESCCEKHEKVTLQQGSTKLTIDNLAMPLLMVVVDLVSPLTLDGAHAFNKQESPPGITVREPLYIIKSSYLL